MKKSLKLSVSLIFLFLTACASNPIVVKKEKIYPANESVYIASTDPSVKQLYIVKKSDTAKVVALKTFQFLFGGSTTGFNKYQLKGNPLDNLSNKERLLNPTSLVYDATKKEIDAIVMGNPIFSSAKFENKIMLSESEGWKLIYDTPPNASETMYRLNYSAYIHRGTNGVSCDYKSDALSLADWEKNDYQKAVDLRGIAVQKCLEQLKPQLAKLMQ